MTEISASLTPQCKPLVTNMVIMEMSRQLSQADIYWEIAVILMELGVVSK